MHFSISLSFSWVQSYVASQGKPVVLEEMEILFHFFKLKSKISFKRQITVGKI